MYLCHIFIFWSFVDWHGGRSELLWNAGFLSVKLISFPLDTFPKGEPALVIWVFLVNILFHSFCTDSLPCPDFLRVSFWHIFTSIWLLSFVSTVVDTLPWSVILDSLRRSDREPVVLSLYIDVVFRSFSLLFSSDRALISIVRSRPVPRLST